MANFPDWADHPGALLCHVKFRPQGTGAPIKDFGNNIAVARTGVGIFTVTFAEKPKGFLGISHAVGNNLANDIRLTGAGYVESNGVLTVTSFADSTTAAVAADIAANANNIVYLWVRFLGQAKI